MRRPKQPKLTEIVLFNTHFDSHGYSLIKKLFKAVLISDPKWHFFWEGDYTVLRVSSDSVKPIIEILEKNIIEHKVKTPWVDNIPITAKYQDCFLDVFHSFSMLAFTMKVPDDVEDVMDRVIHCFSNMIISPKLLKFTEEKFGRYGKGYSEPFLVADYLVRRAISMGFLAGRSSGRLGGR